mgnify:CR=1 FL=1
MPRPSKKTLLMAAAGTLLILALVYLVHFRPLPVSVMVPGRQVPLQVFGLGTVEARILSKVGFKVSGTLAELKVDHGDLVNTGQVLARLDNREQENRLAKSMANQDKAKANLQLAKANLHKARTNLALKQHNNRRRQALLQRGVLAVEAAEEAQAAAETAGAEVALAEAEVTAASAALQDAQAQIGLDKVLLSQHVLLAPYDALIIARHKELGTALPAGEPVFTLADPCSVWVRAFVDEAKAGHLAVGQPAEVRLRSLPGRRFAGKLARIDLESDRVGEERRVYITWDNRPRQFHLGEQAEVVIDTGRLENALLIPQVLVQGYSGNSGQIWTLENGRLYLRQVTLGQSTLDGRLPVLAGLPTGAQVLAALPRGLRQGRRAALQAEARP